MSSITALVEDRIKGAVRKAFGGQVTISGPVIGAATKPEFGHYQSNLALQLAKPLKQKPRAIAEAIVENIDFEGIGFPPEIAGPGFINFTLTPEFITAQLRDELSDHRAGVEPAENPKRVLVDFSSPNVAKELHVGHLRSTIIGDCLSRVLEFKGHDVLRRNHIGDWGTQFGMLIAHLKDRCPEALVEGNKVELGSVVEFYREAKKRFDEDDEFKTVARNEVVKLQAGDPEARKAWQILCDRSRETFNELYETLDIRIEEKGESFYNRYIPETLEELQAQGLTERSDGALCIFSQTADEETPPLIVQKSDGGYNYDSTDMAALRYRVREEKVQEMVYVTDAGQAQHFALIFEAARRAGWLEGVEVVHVPFGMVLGQDKKKFKTRSGDTIRLKDLLDEAVSRARAIVDEKNPELSRERREQVARVVGIGAVKYADLSKNRMSDYVFSFDKMLELQGNTAPYLIYAYVRVQSIARKGTIDFDNLEKSQVQTLETPEELELGYALLGLSDVIDSVASELMPNRLTDYLFDLSQKFSRFYTNNRVLGDPRETTRLALCHLTAETLKLGLSLLGIDVIEQM